MGMPPNKKVPPSAAQEKEGEWYNYSGEVDALGRVRIKYADPENPNDSHEWLVNHDGSFETRETSEDYEGMITKHDHHERKNTSSTSENTEGNADRSFQSTLNQNTFGDMCNAATGKYYKGSDTEIGGSTNGSTCAPQGKSYSLHADNVVMDLKKDRLVSIEGNDITGVKGLCMIMVQGDYGVHAQGSKGLDLQSESQAQLRAAQKINIKSDSEINLEVGNSTVNVRAGQIRMSIGGSSIIMSPQSIIGQSKLIKWNNLICY
jgi:hypothetical protein